MLKLGMFLDIRLDYSDVDWSYMMIGAKSATIRREREIRKTKSLEFYKTLPNGKLCIVQEPSVFEYLVAWLLYLLKFSPSEVVGYRSECTVV